MKGRAGAGADASAARRPVGRGGDMGTDRGRGRGETSALVPWIGLGGAVGATGRFLVGGWIATWAGTGLPWATFVINVLGSVLLGFLNARLSRPLRHVPPPRLPRETRPLRHPRYLRDPERGGFTASPPLRAALTIGLCGGFTTFSTFDLEVLVLLQSGRHPTAAVYALASVLTCVAGLVAGRAAGLRLGGWRIGPRTDIFRG